MTARKTADKKGRSAKAATRGRRIVRWITIAGTTLALGGVVFAVYQFLFVSEFFLIRGIDVTGNRYVSREAVVHRTGIREGDNMLLISLDGADQALESEPWIKSARVERAYPDRIRIEVAEREPLLWLASEQSNRAWALDREAIALPMSRLRDADRELAAAKVRDVTVTGLAPTMANTRAACGPPSLKELLAAWDDEGVFREIRSIRVQDREIVLMPGDRIREIRIGDRDIGRSLAGLERLWQSVVREDLRGEYIDLRFKRQGLVAKFDIADETTWIRLRSTL